LACFFLCSRRRSHTRFSRDWSSDVCSSDLTILHYVVHEFSDCLAAELRIRKDFTSSDYATSWHFKLPIKMTLQVYPACVQSVMYYSLALLYVAWNFHKINAEIRQARR